MATAYFERFRLHDEKENAEIVFTNIANGIVFKGTNLWVLIFAIFVASLGLNVNSPAVIIGAMLISPLMGPIMGIGFSVGINDASLLKKSIKNYCIALLAALATSTIYFLLSPLNDAHSEILARTSPTIYDVLIALFGGLAGMLATSSKIKGNVIPGVAIATALMPPLCTAGYGLATWRPEFFFGAFYLFIINSVFIALAAFIIIRLLKYPLKHLPTASSERIARQTIYAVVIVTLLPSIYFGYDMVQRNEFLKNANNFIDKEAIFPNDYLLSRKIDPKSKNIVLVFGGREITEEEIETFKAKMGNYHLDSSHLQIKQGFAYINDNNELNEDDQFRQLLSQKDSELKKLQAESDSISRINANSQQVFKELQAQFPSISSAVIQPVDEFLQNKSSRKTSIVVLNTRQKLSQAERTKLLNFLKVRLQDSTTQLLFK